LPGAKANDVLETAIPLPPIAEQDRIVCLLKGADRLRRMRRYALAMCDEFLPGAFLNLFDDPEANPKRFAIVELGDLLSFVTSGSRGWAESYVPIGDRFIRSLDVRMNSISDEDAVFVDPSRGAEADRTRVKSGDVLLTITGSQIGRVAPAPARVEGSFISQHVAILRLKSGLLPIFLSMFLSLDAAYDVRDANGHTLAFVYSRDSDAEARQAKVAVNIARLQELLGRRIAID